MSSKSKVTGEGVQTVTSTRLRRIRPAPCKEPKHSSEKAKHRRSKKKEAEKKAASDFERRQRRRESDARCRANLSSGFDFLRSQVEHHQAAHMKMSKEALLYNSIDQIRYLEAVLVLLQQTKEKSSGKATSKPVDVLQKIHKKFVSEKDGILEETLILQGDSSLRPEISTGPGNSSSFAVQSAKDSVKRQPLKEASSMAHPSKEDPSLVLTTQRKKVIHKRTLPNILVKKSDENSPSSKKRGQPITPKSSQEVPKTPQRRGGSGGMERDIHQVPGTPVNIVDSLDDNLEISSSVKHYRIRGQQIESTTPKDPSRSNCRVDLVVSGEENHVINSDALKMCNNCQIQDSEGSIDLTCHEDPEDWKKEGFFDDHLHTPHQRKCPSQDLYVTPNLKRKTLPTPSNSEGRSRKCLFKNTSPIADDKSTIQLKSPRRRYSKRATAARTRPWDSVAMKVTSPFQPYSGVYGQRKKIQANKNAARAKATPDTARIKTTLQAGNQGLVSRGGDHQSLSMRGTSSTKNTFATRPKSHGIPKNSALGDGNEDCRSSSQDSLSIQEIPNLPEDILNFISRGGVPLFSDPEEPLDLSLNSTRQLYNILGDDYSPLEMSSTSVPFDDFCGEERRFAHEDRSNFDISSEEFPQYNFVSDYHQYVDNTFPSPSQSRVLFPSNTSGESCYLEAPSHPVGILDRMDQRNVWQGGRNQDITLAQLQRQPIFGNQDSVYESPQWNRTPFAPHLHPCTESEWIDVESSETGGVSSACQDSWDTADFLSSVDTGSRHETLSGSSPQSSSSSFVIPYGCQTDCAAVRDIEEYQVVPFYQPEE